MKNVGIFVIVFGVKRAFHSHISTERYAIYRAFGMLIFNCIFIARSTTSSASPSQFSVSRLPLSTSSIPHPETWFGRLILKEVDFNAELFVKATCQNKTLTPLLKSPLIHLARLSLSKSRFPRLAPLLSPSPQVLLIINYVIIPMRWLITGSPSLCTKG